MFGESIKWNDLCISVFADAVSQCSSTASPWTSTGPWQVFKSKQLLVIKKGLFFLRTVGTRRFCLWPVFCLTDCLWIVCTDGGGVAWDSGCGGPLGDAGVAYTLLGAYLYGVQACLGGPPTATARTLWGRAYWVGQNPKRGRYTLWDTTLVWVRLG
jgi:hypothetical protein